MENGFDTGNGILTFPVYDSQQKDIGTCTRSPSGWPLFFCVCASDLPDFPIIPLRRRAVRRSEARYGGGAINHTHGKRGALIRAVAGRHGDFPRSTVRGVRPLP